MEQHESALAECLTQLQGVEALLQASPGDPELLALQEQLCVNMCARRCNLSLLLMMGCAD